MKRARSIKLKFLGAVALSSTALISTTAIAAGTAAAFLLYTTTSAVKGGGDVKWQDVVSVLTLSALPSTSSKQNLTLASRSTTISQPGTVKPVDDGTAVKTVLPTKLGINLTSPAYFLGNRSFMNLLSGDSWRLINAQGGMGDMPADRLDANKRLVRLNAGEQGVRVISAPTKGQRGLSVDVICRWQGTGAVFAYGDRVKNVKVSGRSLTYTYVPVGDPGMRIQISSTSASDPVHSVDCREADADPNAFFDPTYLAEIGRYSVIRFMKWGYGGVEGNLPTTWAARTKPTDEVVLGKEGIAIENMIRLANEVKADPWFSIPWNADAEYVRKFAEMVRTQLDPNLKAYVEVSNEVWNYVYPVTSQARAEAKAAGLSSDEHMGMLLRYSQKTGEVMDVWSSVFAGQMNRIVRVAAVQTGAWSAEVVLSYGNTASKLDAIASAPYFNSHLDDNALATPAAVDTFFRDLGNSIPTRIAEAKGVKDMAAKFGLRYIAYEAGQHVTGTMPLARMVAVQSDVRMGNLYTAYLTQWKEQLGDLMVLFADYGDVSQYGAFGQKNYVGQPLSEAPKENAVDLFRKSYVTR